MSHGRHVKGAGPGSVPSEDATPEPGPLVTSQVADSLLVLPTQTVRALIVQGLYRDAIEAIDKFESNWTQLQTRLIALLTNYLKFLDREYGPEEVFRVQEWLSCPIGRVLSLRLKEDSVNMGAAILHSVGRVRGNDVSGPLREDAKVFAFADAVSILRSALEENAESRAQDMCQLLEDEWHSLQDRLVHLCAMYSTYIAETHGEEVMNTAHEWIAVEAMSELTDMLSGERTRDETVRSALRLMRTHTMAGKLERNTDVTTIQVDCSSGLRMWRRRVPKHGAISETKPWSFGRNNLPYYCCRCTCAIMTAPEMTSGRPLWEISPPRSSSDTCTWSFDG